MWKETTMSVGQSLIISGMGLLVVVGALALLAIAIIILSKLVGMMTGGSKTPAAAVAAPAPAAVVNDLDEEAYAVLIAAVSEETHMPLNSFQVTEIKEIG